MSPMPRDPFGAVPHAMRWCPHCNGYGSSLKEEAERSTRCAGIGLMVGNAAALSAEQGETVRPSAISRAPARHLPAAATSACGEVLADAGKFEHAAAAGGFANRNALPS
jgi:hypothetical protein